eukprot:TCONS_00014307-protein
MAERQQGYGFTAEVSEKIAGKYDSNQEREAVAWIRSLVPDSGLDQSEYGAEALAEKLNDGTILCKLANALESRAVPKMNTSKMAFKKMENINFFLEFSYRFGCNKTDMFQTVDLYEATNMAQVVNGLHALGRKANAKGKSGIGPKESNKNERNFSEEQIRQGRDAQIGLQAGTNKFANQSGQNFGKTRAIID